MKEKHSGTDAKLMPPCPLSAQCVNWLDEIDAYIIGHHPANLSAEEQDDFHFAVELAEHAQRCTLCQHALTHARKQRNTLRTALRTTLDEGERFVPDTTVRILAALRQEVATPGPIRKPAPKQVHTPLPPVAVTPLPRAKSYRRKSLALPWAVAAIVILASIAAFGQFILLRPTGTPLSTTSNTPKPTSETAEVMASSTHQQQDTTTLMKPIQPPQTKTWSSVALTRVENARTVVEHIDPLEGKQNTLFPEPCCPINTTIDSIAHAGNDIAYRYFDGQKTSYVLLSSGEIYTIKGKGGNAIWSTEDASLYINSPEGILQVDKKSRQSSLIWPRGQYSKLDFYYNNAIYASREGKGIKDLYRIDLATKQEQRVVTGAMPAYSFWLDLKIKGTTIYYVKATPDEQMGLYQANQDGTNERLVRQDAIPIGYMPEPDLSLVVMSLTNQGEFAVKTLKDAPELDETLYDNIAPGASAICNEQIPQNAMLICERDIAMIPEMGTYIVFGAFYDAGYRLMAINLQQPEQPAKQLAEFPNHPSPQIQLIGWDKFKAA